MDTGKERSIRSCTPPPDTLTGDGTAVSKRLKRVPLLRWSERAGFLEVSAGLHFAVDRHTHKS
ncbi:MAG: hypothetical protein ABSG49_00770 [Methanoregula sp.]|jgi:hypothetical protein